jgi:hypothetical protein
MNSFRDILLQIIDVIGLRKWKDREIDDFLAMAEVEAMLNLIEALPKDKQAPIIDQFMFMSKKTPRDVERMFGRYYSAAHMREAVSTRTKKSIVQHVVEPNNPELTPAQRERILALLAQLTIGK